MSYHPIVNYSPFGDTTYTKVFVGGLAWETQSDSVRRHFEHFGEILEAVVISDKSTGRSKGYGFVTFRDPEAARRACVDPAPIIDRRQANCNLASLGRPRPSLPFERARPVSPYIGGAQATHGPYVGSFGYQPPVPYQHGYVYPQYGYATYGPGYVYPQGVYNPYASQQYLPIYRSIYPYGQMGQTIPGAHGYTAVHNYAMSANQILQFGGPSVATLTTSAIPTIQAPYPASMASQQQSQFIVPAHLQFMPANSSDQTAG